MTLRAELEIAEERIAELQRKNHALERQLAYVRAQLNPSLPLEDRIELISHHPWKTGTNSSVTGWSDRS